ncbi:MAG: diguanylate cyclase [Rhodospirillaceae bacterium]
MILGLPRLLRIRTLLVSIVLVMAIPIIVAVLCDLGYQAEAIRQQAGDNALRLARVTAADTARRIAETRGFLARLSELPGVYSLDPKRCDPQFINFPKFHIGYANLLTKKLDGTVVCSSLAVTPGTRQTNPTFSINELIRTQAFVIGRPNRGFISGRWVVTLEYPLFDRGHILIGMVGASIDLARFNPLVGDAAFQTLPEHTLASLLDSKGIILARSIDPDKWVGADRSGSPSTTQLIALHQGIITLTAGIDHIKRMIGVAPVEGTDWIATVGIPTTPIDTAIRRHYMLWLTGLTGGIGLIIGLALWLSRQIARPIQAVARTAEAVASGRLDQRTPIEARSGFAEMATVAGQFDAMLDSLAEERQRTEESDARYRILSLFDPLTQLPNRHLLRDRLCHTLTAVDCHAHNGAVLVIDLDNFKTINDTSGHAIGDRLLIMVGKRLLSCVRSRDWVARPGGDEFVVVLEDLGTDTEKAAAQAEEVATRILNALRSPFSVGEADAPRNYHGTASIGICLFHAYRLDAHTH